MKIDLNTIKWFLDFDLPAVDEVVEKIGSQLGAVEEVIDVGKKYQGIIIAKVVECRKLEGTDHLSLCKIDDGGVAKDVERDDKGLVQVVCGAPNVHEGLTVAWLPPGATVRLDDERGPPAGEPPLTLPRVVVGPHRIFLERAGFAKASASVQVQAGVEATVVLPLARVKGRVPH